MKAERIDPDDLEPALLAKCIATLLFGFSTKLKTNSCLSKNVKEQFTFVLEGFRAKCELAIRHDTEQSLSEKTALEALIAGFGEKIEVLRKDQETKAEDFVILDVLQLTFNEVRHSMLLAWLLDHNMTRSGTHAQGTLGFRLFLKRLKLPETYADFGYSVRREVVGEEARIDLEISSQCRFLIHIEVKIGAGEGEKQTLREWNDLLRRAESLKVAREHVMAFFLTPLGVPASNELFRPISWDEIADTLDEFSLHAMAPDVKLFAAHYARALRKFVIESSENLYG